MRTDIAFFFHYGNKGVLYIRFTGSIRFAFNLITMCNFEPRQPSRQPNTGVDIVSALHKSHTAYRAPSRIVANGARIGRYSCGGFLIT